ncbi:MAG: sulfatase [Chloroflexota bacterium]|nr:sulfatase [Chloroflexota bacterium]
MRILYIDIDSLRADHLGCYGYHRNTSPNIDAVARDGVRFENCYATDVPCLPSRSALWSGRFGYHTGVVGHGGTAAQPFVEGPARGFRDAFDGSSWMRAMRDAGLRTATVSPFGERHAAWHWYAGFNEIFNTGKGGNESADDITPVALDWLERNARSEDWFLHVNYWDPHTPYRTPLDFGNPFEDEPLAPWLCEEMRQRCWDGFGPHSAQDLHGYGGETGWRRFPRLPESLDSMASVRQWIDGYDAGIRFADAHIGRLLDALDDAGVLQETVIVVSADHGENQGELNVWGDHHTADQITCRVPLIVRWPGLGEELRVDRALHYHFDWAATLIELAGGQVPDNWDGESFAAALEMGKEAGRPYLVLSQNAWACQRSVRFDDYLCLRTYHDGLKELDPVMLFDLLADPHEQQNLACERPELVDRAMALLAEWQHEMMLTSDYAIDPMMTVLREGGPFHTRGMLPEYARRLRATGRGHHADRLMAIHPDEIDP